MDKIKNWIYIVIAGITIIGFIGNAAIAGNNIKSNEKSLSDHETRIREVEGYMQRQTIATENIQQDISDQKDTNKEIIKLLYDIKGQ